MKCSNDTMATKDSKYKITSGFLIIISYSCIKSWANWSDFRWCSSWSQFLKMLQKASNVFLISSVKLFLKKIKKTIQLLANIIKHFPKSKGWCITWTVWMHGCTNLNSCIYSLNAQRNMEMQIFKSLNALRKWKFACKGEEIIILYWDARSVY